MVALAAALPYITAVGTAVSVASGVKSFIDSRRAGARNAAAQQLQQASINQQAAVQKRATISAQNDAATLDLQAANQSRSAAANRRTRGGLQYAGPSSLKTTLGG